MRPSATADIERDGKPATGQRGDGMAEDARCSVIFALPEGARSAAAAFSEKPPRVQIEPQRRHARLAPQLASHPHNPPRISPRRINRMKSASRLAPIVPWDTKNASIEMPRHSHPRAL
jgi:hypothetical protein